MNIQINTKLRTIIVTEATIEELLSIPDIKEYKIISKIINDNFPKLPYIPPNPKLPMTPFFPTV